MPTLLDAAALNLETFYLVKQEAGVQPRPETPGSAAAAAAFYTIKRKSTEKLHIQCKTLNINHFPN